MKTVLALSGSLRAISINTAFCRAAAQLAPPTLAVQVFGGLGELPLFNPDLESQPPHAVQALRSAVARADALLIASPEYAHGISGVMKNALDWLVSDEGAIGKPVAVVNTSPRARHAYDSLQEVLRTMPLDIVADASVAIPLLGGCVTEEAMLADTEVCGIIAGAMNSLSAYLSGLASRGAAFPLG